MKIPPVKGTRDFYPQEMSVHNWIIDGWKKVSLRNGFEEYDGPIFEYLKMFQVKSGDEIVEQLFSLTDRGGRDLALRPEMTPTLARMVNQKINSLPKPIKWFSVPRLFRAERPQKGRLREFFQWNIDIIGVDDVLADAEVIFTTIDYLRQTGLTPNDIVVRVSSRRMLKAIMKSIGISDQRLIPLYA
ncbi:MAG: ATP phosphoribosyltransferase regulatory subunit, partial [Sedimentisphaerales bacterium]